MAKKWEYLVIELCISEREQKAYFNGLGNDGWELVAVATQVVDSGGLGAYQYAYFKREKA